MSKYPVLGVIAFLIVVAIAFYALRFRPAAMTLTGARAIATAAVSECAQKGTVGENGMFNENSNTWWIDFTPKPEFAQMGCNPACVVDATTKGAEINWRCTGAIAPATYDDLLQVDTPLPNASVTSPLTITGKARGEWYFEASFPVTLYDANNKLIAQAPAQAQGDWMTEDYVPFSAELTYSATTSTGTLVIQNDNPSGLPENQKEVRIPVTFAAQATDVTHIKLYYYNPALDQGPGGAQCSAKGLVAVNRSIPKTQTPLTVAIRELLKGELSAQEESQGVQSEFPLAGVTLTGANIVNGVATLTFSDPQNKTSGGSCRVSVLRAQIEATAKQFPSVTSVQIKPAELFQP